MSDLGDSSDDSGNDTCDTDRRAIGRVLDPPALRALAHPLRFQLVELLIEHGPSTASELGRRVGESSGLTSYHLRELAKHDLIEEAPELGSARDRWWRPVKGGYTLAGFEMLESDETRADAQFLLSEVIRARFDRLRRWHEDAPTWGEAWASSSTEMTSRLRLTREELGSMSDELVAVVDRFRSLQAGRDQPGASASDAVPVTVQIDAFPSGDPPTHGPADTEPHPGTDPLD
jgi:DNA-binding transcriptional ArsR family regulator